VQLPLRMPVYMLACMYVCVHGRVRTQMSVHAKNAQLQLTGLALATLQPLRLLLPPPLLWLLEQGPGSSWRTFAP